MKGQIRPNEMGKIELRFWHIVFCIEDRAYMMVYGDSFFFIIFRHCASDP
jgi:hypothetical protein